MKLSSNTRYAIRILFELEGAKSPVSIGNLSEKTGVALRTVEHISTELRKQEITRSILGAGGGIMLNRPLSDITLGQLVSLFDGGVAFVVCCGEKSNDCPNQSECKNRAVWRDVSEKFQYELDSISLENLLSLHGDGRFAWRTAGKEKKKFF